MGFKEITSRQNHFVKYMLTLKDKKTRDREKTCLVEGLKILFDLAEKQYPIRMFFTTNEMLKKYPKETEKIGMRSSYNFVTDESIIKALSTTETTGGFIAAVETPYINPLMYEYENEGFYICADNIQDPGNVGNIFRTASAFELSGVILYKHCADPFGPKAIRGSVGQSLILPAIQIDELDLLNDMKKSGYKIYITESEGNISLNKFKFPKSTCIIFGNEGKGISKELREIADGVIQIPISKNTESLNVSTSVSIIGWEWFKNR